MARQSYLTPKVDTKEAIQAYLSLVERPLTQGGEFTFSKDYVVNMLKEMLTPYSAFRHFSPPADRFFYTRRSMVLYGRLADLNAKGDFRKVTEQILQDLPGDSAVKDK